MVALLLALLRLHVVSEHFEHLVPLFSLPSPPLLLGTLLLMQALQLVQALHAWGKGVAALSLAACWRCVPGNPSPLGGYGLLFGLLRFI